MPRTRSPSRSRSRSRGKSRGRPSRYRSRSESRDRYRGRRRSRSYDRRRSPSRSRRSRRSRSYSSSRSRSRSRRSRSYSSSRSRSRSYSSRSESRSPSRSRSRSRGKSRRDDDGRERDSKKRDRSDSRDEKNTKRQHTGKDDRDRKSDDVKEKVEDKENADRSTPKPVEEQENTKQIQDEKVNVKKDEKTPPQLSKSEAEGSNDDKTPPRSSKSQARRSSESKTPPRRHKAEKEDTPPSKSSKKDKSSKKRSSRRSRRSRSSSTSSSSSSSSDSDTPEKAPKKKRSPKKDSPKKDAPEQESEGVYPKPNQPDILTEKRMTRTGGVYIPPFKLARMQAEEKDPSSEQYQRQTWDALRKSLNGIVNKVSMSNIRYLLPELFQENLVRGRGLLARSIMKAQMASPGFTHIYAALVAVLNTKMPENGELIVKRVVLRFRRSLKRGDKIVALALVKFLAHLVNQQVVHELLALEVLLLLLSNPTDDSIEVAVNFTKECGQLLAELCPEGLRDIFERFRGILHEGEIDKRVQYTIEGLFAIRKNGFADYPAVPEELDLVETGDQITHTTTLDEKIDAEDKLDVFRFDPEYEKNEEMWEQIKKEVLGEDDSESEDGSEESEEEEEENQAATQTQEIQDMTEQDLVNLRRTIYLTIMSSVSHEECAHKLMKMQIRPGQEKEVCGMLIECCSQERTYLRYYGLLGQRFCLIKREYQDAFDVCFAEQYAVIHRLETNKLRNVAKFFAHLLFTDALPWTVFEYIRLNEEETTSSSRIFVKILCQELSEHLGMKTLKERFNDELMQQTFAGLFPRENPRNTRFAINFFTSIGLGGLTTELREHLKNAPQMIMQQGKKEDDSSSDSSSSSSDSDSSSSDSDSSGSDSSSSDSDSE